MLELLILMLEVLMLKVLKVLMSMLLTICADSSYEKEHCQGFALAREGST